MACEQQRHRLAKHCEATNAKHSRCISGGAYGDTVQILDTPADADDLDMTLERDLTARTATTHTHIVEPENRKVEVMELTLGDVVDEVQICGNCHSSFEHDFSQRRCRCRTTSPLWYSSNVPLREHGIQPILICFDACITISFELISKSSGLTKSVLFIREVFQPIQ